MKYKVMAPFVAISLAALLLIGCGKSSSDSDGKSAKTTTEYANNRGGEKKGQSKFDVDFEWYTRNKIDEDELDNGFKSYSVSASMQKYFLAYGARDIRYSASSDGEQLDLVIEFKNGILFGMQFHKGESSQQLEIGGNAGYFIVSVRDDAYHPNFYQDIDSSRTEEHIEFYDGKPFWYREFDIYDLEKKYVPEDIEEANRDYIRTVYAFGFDDITQNYGALCLPGYFDEFFRNSVAPYLELDNPAKDVDPLKDDKNIDGYYYNMQYVKVPNSDGMELEIDSNAG